MLSMRTVGLLVLVGVLIGSATGFHAATADVAQCPCEPIVRDIDYAMVTFEEPVRIGYGEGAQYFSEALAFRVVVDPYVEMDIEPFLYVGDVEIRGHTVARGPDAFQLTFYAFEPDALEDGASVVLTTHHDWMSRFPEFAEESPFRFFRERIRWGQGSSPDPERFESMHVELLDPQGRPIEVVEAGDSLTVSLSGLPPGAPIEIYLLDEQDQEWSYARLFADREGTVDPTLFWYQSGVIGATDREIEWRPDLAFETFEEAAEYFVNVGLRLEFRALDGQLVRVTDVPFSPRRTTPLLYPSTGDGVLLNSMEAGRNPMYVSGRNFPAGSTVLLFVVPNRFGWNEGEPVIDVTGSGYSQAVDVVRLDEAETSFTVPVWDGDWTQPGAYDLVARIVDVIPENLRDLNFSFRETDIAPFTMDTGILCYTIINGNIVIESAGRKLPWPSYFEYSDSFERHESVYAAVDPTDVPATHTGGNYAAYFVVDHKPSSYWDGTIAPGALVDVSGGAEIHRVKYWCINVSRRKVWPDPDPTGPINEYDLIVDFGSFPAQTSGQFTHDYTYTKGTDFIDGYNKVGFYVLDDPGKTGSYAVGSNDYYDDTFNTPVNANDPFNLTSSGFPLVRNWFTIRYPAATAGVGAALPSGTDKYPVVLFLHGRHGVCSTGTGPFSCSYDTTCATGTRIPSHKGYNYILDVLASQGIIAISIDAYDIQPSGGYYNYEARGRLILEHLNRLKSWNASGTDPFGGVFQNRIDMTKIAIVGHSRGGEGVVAAAKINVTEAATYGYDIVAVIAIAPTDQQSGTPWDIESAPYFMLTGARDGDVDNQQGFRTYDRAYSIGASPQHAKCALWIYGANHNYFNTIWTPNPQLPAQYQHTYGCARDEGSSWTGPKITAAEQRAIALSTISAFARLYLQGIEVYRAIFTGELELAGIKNDVLHWSYQDPNRLALDDFEQSPHLTAQNTRGGTVILTGFSQQSEAFFKDGYPSADPCSYHLTWGIALGWGASATYVSELPAADKDVSVYTHLSFRVTVIPDNGTLNPVGSPMVLHVNIEDTDGDSATYSRPTDNFTDIPYPYQRSATSCQCQMKTVRIPLSTFTQNNTDVDLDRIKKVTISFSTTGLVGIDDIQFSE